MNSWSKELRRWVARARILLEGVTSVQGPVERIDGKLTLRIPLAAGGQKLIRCSRGVGYVDGEFLTVVIPDWLAEKMEISDGSVVVVDNRKARFNIWPQQTTGQPAHGDDSN